MSERLTLTIEARFPGQRKPIVPGWTVSVPRTPTTATGGQHDSLQRMTLREVLTLVVTDEVAAFNQRQRERRLPRIMTRAEIEQGAASGKVDMGGREPQEARVEDAIAAALQAFADRLYLVLLDGAPVEALESELALHEGSRLTFVRLVALVGG
ncbi:MAG TPA: hypothetical protein VFQ25_09170 [Ktedonobacterales bacterium]|nr:hypothetical protein [Ktedonobacterales bacterium]